MFVEFAVGAFAEIAACRTTERVGGSQANGKAGWQGSVIPRPDSSTPTPTLIGGYAVPNRRKGWKPTEKCETIPNISSVNKTTWNKEAVWGSMSVTTRNGGNPQETVTVIERYEDQPDELTIHPDPDNCTDQVLMTRWISAQEGSFVSLASMQ